MAQIRFLTADVFTDRAFTGNPLAVVPDARGLDARRMQLVAREFDYSETTFVFPAEDRRHTRRVRIFTPAAEIPFAGHPTLGTAFVLAAIGEIPLTGEETRIVLEEGAGPVPVTIRAGAGRPTSCELAAPKLPERGPEAPPPEAIAAALSLSPGDLAGGEWRAEVFSCGLPFLFVPLRSLEAVARARIDHGRWSPLGRALGVTGVHVFTLETQSPAADVHARMFAPDAGVPEDPATGAASAALAGVLAPRDRRQGATLRWVIEQGLEMGRPSRIVVEADREGGRLTAVRVGGAAVLVSEGRMEVP
ncbi:MAG: PhzF family phenazine biosynthesis protein [Candidatus Binatia bacterium]